MIIKKFLTQVERTPEAFAVKTIRESITFRRLYRYGCRVAEALTPDMAGERVALLFQHGVDMIASLVGSCMRGAVFVPLDRTYPEHRLVYMLENSGARVILSNSTNFSLAERLARQLEEPTPIICIDRLPEEARETEPPVLDLNPASLAYILYTSGSTGMPKGVMQTRGNLLYYVRNWIERFSLQPGERMTFLTAFSHDGAQQDIWSALLSGSTLYPFDIKQQAGSRLLTEWVKEECITVWHSVPTLFRFFVDSLSPEDRFDELRWILLGGEPLRDRDIELFDRYFPAAGLANVYGQTESSVNSIWAHRAGDSARLGELGEPLDNTELLLVNDDGEVVEDIGSGEIVVACPHIAPGYWRNDGASEDKFSEDPDMGRLYWTGDLGGLKGSGAIEILGRRDFQVKIRGFRVETGEIESSLLRHDAVAEAVVQLKTDRKGEPFLCAYLVPTAGQDVVEHNLLRQFLGRYLPDYMIPAQFVHLDQMPLTPNGKIDRQALPDPALLVDQNTPMTPLASPTEETLADIWAGELKIDPSEIYQESNFFELGGHSLKGVNVIAKVHRALKAKLELEDIFLYPQLKELAAHIDGSGTESYQPIPPAPPRPYYQTSSQQRRLFFLQQMAPESTAYNLPDLFEFNGRLDLEKINGVFRQMTRRHESLRTSFRMEDARPVQVILPEADVQVEIHDFTAVEEKDPVKNGHVRRVISEFVRPFQLDAAPLLRAALLSFSGDRQLFLVDAHHIIADGMSLELFFNEFRSLYEGQSLPTLRLQYKDYSEWLLQDGRKENLLKQQDFWLTQFSGEIPVLQLPTDFPRPAVRGFDGGKLRFSFDSYLSGRLSEFSSDKGTTLYMLLLAVVGVLLHKLSRQEDIIVGTPVAGRQHVDVRNIIGMFVNTLPLRAFPAKVKRFSDLLREIRQTTIRAFDNQDYPFEDLVEKVAIQRDTSRSPLFDVMFGLHNQSSVIEDGATFSYDLKGSIPEFQRHIAKFDLTLHAIEGNDILMFSLEYSAELFKFSTVERFVRYFEAIARSVSESPEIELQDIEILSPEEKRQLLIEFNNTTTPYLDNDTIYEIFAGQVAQTPDRIALTGENQLTYRGFHVSAEAIALHLQERGTGPGSIVPFIMDRSVEMMQAIFGIIASGAAYLPIVPTMPGERISRILADCAAQLLVTSQTAACEFSFDGQRIIVEDIDPMETSSRSLSQKAGPADPLYVIYTSGSTGMPKGVIVENKPVVNRLRWMQKQYPLTARDVLLQKTTVMFDVSVWELFWWSLAGARLALLGAGLEKFPEAIVAALRRFQVSAVHFVPSMLQAFLRYLQDTPGSHLECASLKRVFASGEALEPAHVQAFKNNLAVYNDCQLNNLYGPTEATVDVSYFDCPLDPAPSVIPIGRPIDNTTLLVIDEGRLQPVGVQGELWIGGVPLARGYLNRPELTAETFIHCDAGNGIRRYYRTGDLTCVREDGNIQYLGRIDQQVKLRGFRIELGEIRHCLLEHPLVDDALPLVIGDLTGDPALTAYLVLRESADKAIPAIRDAISRRLPEYMIPTFFVPLDHIPLTGSGKIDRRALPVPTAAGGLEEKNPVAGPWEEKLAALWAEVLGLNIQAIGALDNFFRLGGHSLKATVLASYIHRDFDVRLPLPQIFNTPTVRGLARYIQNAARERFREISPAAVCEEYPLSSAQKRMYILQQIDGDGTTYHIPQAVPVNRDTDPDDIRRTLQKITERHESFRTSFHIVAGEPVQKIHQHADIDFEYYDLTEDEPHADSNAAVIMKRFIRPFDLKIPPLLRVALLKQGSERFLLLCDMHHIVSDGVSMDILVKDFLDIYKGDVPPPLRLQYKDFAVWQNLEFTRAMLDEQETFWLDRLSGELPVLDLPLDYIRPAVQDFSGDAESFEIGAEGLFRLRQAASSNDATLFMAMLAAVYCWLFYLTRQEDIIVGSPVAGRSHADCAGIIGMFVNTLAMRARPSGEKSFYAFLKEVRVGVLEALDNQDYPFEELVDRVAAVRDAGRNPLFDVMFALHEGGADEGGDVPVFGKAAARFDLTVTVVAFESRMNVKVEYGTRLFRPESIRCFGRLFCQVVASVAAYPDRPLSLLDIASPEEKERVLHKFNDTALPFPEECTIPALFYRQAAMFPNRIALLWEANNHLSYRELDRSASRLAVKLMGKGVKEQAIVALVARRGAAMISGILGILKAGCAYLPIDPGYPTARIAFMLQDSAASVAVSTEGEHPPLESVDMVAHGATEGGECLPEDAFGYVSHPDHPVYIIYTSGTTGKPKGTLTTHRNAVRVVKNTNYIDIQATDRLLQLSNFAFDGSIFDIFGAMLNGAALLLPTEAQIRSARIVCDLIRQRQVTVFFVTTALFNTLVDVDLPSLQGVRRILFGGERVSVDHARRALDYLGPHKIIHVYGPTETTVFATYFPIAGIEERALTIPIGMPLANTSIYILSETKKILPVGVPGELYIGGPGLARGYLNRPELTLEKFVSDPFNPEERLYASGDLGRFLDGGAVEFLGRIDQQLKIRGFRIEPAEIQRHLLGLSGIRDAVVVPAEDSVGEIFLSAYIVADDDLDATEVRRMLQHSLPEYMIPAVIVPIPAIPLNSSGKVDRAALPAPRAAVADAVAPPRTRLDEQLRRIWAGILGKEEDQIGIDSGFFDIGGHSLRATVLAAKIQKAFGVKIPLTEIFRNPTIRGIAAFLKQAAPAKDEGPLAVEKREYYPLASEQKRMYLIQAMSPGSTLYNMPYPMLLNRPLEIGLVQTIFNKLIQRHESLRTRCAIVNGEPVQIVQDFAEVSVESLVGFAPEEEALDRFIRPFRLDEAPLLRVAYGSRNDGKTTLLVDMHHIISDGTTIGILLSDFTHLAGGEFLPQLPLQYKDYACWQKARLESPAGAAQEEYWLREFSGELPVLDLPVDFPRVPHPSSHGQSFEFDLAPDVTGSLRKLAGNLNISVFMVSLGLLNLLLASLSGQEDVVVGTVTAGREYDQLLSIAGMFVNTLPLRNFPGPGRSCAEFLEETGRRALQAFENQDIQFEYLVERLACNYNDGRHPLFDVLISMQNIDMPRLESGVADLETMTTGTGDRPQQAKFDLTFRVGESADRLRYSCVYRSSLWQPATIARFCRYFSNICAQVAENPRHDIAAIDILSEDERRWLLLELNDTQAEMPAHPLLWRMFRDRAASVPDEIAVTAPFMEPLSYHLEHQVSLSWLLQRSASLSECLGRQGAGPDRIVAICLQRTVEMIAAILGVLRAGGAYLPIDISCPLQRMEFLLRDSGAAIVVTDRALRRRVEALQTRPLCIQIDTLNGGSRDEVEETIGVEPHHLAYVIYTSGSTGMPKGVLVENRNAANTIQWFRKRYQLDGRDRILQLTRYTFDASVNQIFGALFSGSRLCVADLDRMGSLQQLRRDIERQRITLVNFVPRLLDELFAGVNPIGDVKTVVSGGESLEPGLKNRLLEAGYRVANQYGPTEATIDALAEECGTEPVTLGRPIANTQCYVLDRRNHPCAPGVAGELCIAGAGVVRGYLNNPEKTDLLFVDHPFGEGKMYRTGDVCRITSEGRFQFAGRMDRQVKIRGNRVELGEIEAILQEQETIEDAVVLLRSFPDRQPVLTAYVVTAPPNNTCNTGTELEAFWRNWMAERAPSYMMPDFFIPIERIPLSANGKLDAGALPVPEIDEGYDCAAPSTPAQETLVKIWKRVLKKNTVGIDHNFFQLGGNSLTVFQLISGIYDVYGVDWPVARIFQTPVLKDQAALLEGNSNESAVAEPGLLINKRRERYLFCFPPGIGYGMSYMQLGQYLDDVALYAFDYIDEPDILSRYVSTIERHQPEGPIMLLGYSAGGRPAFKVAELLEKRGRDVSDIILLDCYSRRREIDPEEAAELDRILIRDLKAGMQRLGLEFMHERVIDTMNLYKEYHRNLVLDGAVNAVIHLIQANGAANGSEGWHKFSKHPQRDYRGYGSHSEMLSFGYIEKNSAIIKSILNSRGTMAAGDFRLTSQMLDSHRVLSPTAAGFLEYVSLHPDMLDASNYRRLLADDNFFKMNPWPVFVNNELSREMEIATMSVFRLIRDIPRRLFGNDTARMSAYYHLPEAMIDIQTEGIIEPHYDRLLARGDYVLSRDGFKCIEYNVLSNLGGLQIPHWEQLYLDNSKIKEFINHSGMRLRQNRLLPLFFHNLVECALEFNVDIRDEVNLAIVFQDYDENQAVSALSLKNYLNDVYRRELQNYGDIRCGEVVVCDFTNMNVQDDGLYYNDKKINIAVEMYGGILPPEILRLFKNRSLALFNGPVTGLLTNKLNLALLSENQKNPVFSDDEQKAIGKYIPWSRSLVRGATTFDGATVDLEDFVLRQREMLVMKPASRYGGSGVAIGKNTDPEEWKALLQQALLEKRWLVQQYHRSYPWMFQSGDCGIEPHDIVWGFFAFGPYYGGGCVRLLPQSNRSGVINVHQGATSSMVFEVDE